MSIREWFIQQIPTPLLRLFAKPYIAGDSIQKAIKQADKLWQEQGLYSIIDLLGEGIKEQQDIQHELDEYNLMLEAIKGREYISLSLKPTQMGLDIDEELCYQNIEQIVKKAALQKIHVTLDMEESRYVDATLRLYQNLRKNHDNVGTVLQSRLFRTHDDIDKYLTQPNACIRLCIGIYNEAPEIAYQKKAEMKENFFRLLLKLWDSQHFVGIATHDEQLLQKCTQAAKEKGKNAKHFEAQMLLGVPRQQTQQQFLKEDIKVHIYVPYGTTWDHAYGYAKRRLSENPHIGLYVIINLFRRIFTSSDKAKANLPSDLDK